MAKILLVLLMVFLTSCSHMGKHDGPPNFYVDESKIGNAVPKPEKLSKLGNMRTYRVFGKRYYTLRSSKNYNQVGIASWYGTQFHEHSTSSGEPYDMLAMTAAHKTLPLPTYVEVTNLRNKRKVVVKVNDRGPFESNRIIDLSYVAAKKLGMLGHGTALVRVKALDPYGNNKHIDSVQQWLPRTPSQLIYFQVGAFKNKNNALRLKQKLASLLKVPVSIPHRVTNTGLYRVQVGPIKDLSTADKVNHRLKTLGIKPDKKTGV